MPRLRGGTFEPQIVRARQRQLNGVDEIVLSLYAKGLMTEETPADRTARRSGWPHVRSEERVFDECSEWPAPKLEIVAEAVGLAHVDSRC